MSVSDITLGAMTEMQSELDAMSESILTAMRQECRPEKWVTEKLPELESAMTKQDGNHPAVRATISYLDYLKHCANLAGTRRLPMEQLEFCQSHVGKLREGFRSVAGIE